MTVLITTGTMLLSSPFVRSLVLAGVISSAGPALLIGGLLGSLLLLGYTPGLGELGLWAHHQILTFLTTFGNGRPWEGVIAICLACGSVGLMFEVYVYSQYHRPS
ncbi:MAG: hypothetical protein IGQ88_00830 [Gloeomargaritaceae cyanobacterium C42_A2020_066]|nr:hypothetical protein [Gloeomargaritaceae cyanobacterium C42_A2020_066]